MGNYSCKKIFLMT